MKKHALPEQTCSHCVLIPTSVHEEMHPRAIKCYANPNNNHYTLVLIAKRLGRLLKRSRRDEEGQTKKKPMTKISGKEEKKPMTHGRGQSKETAHDTWSKA